MYLSLCVCVCICLIWDNFFSSMCAFHSLSFWDYRLLCMKKVEFPMWFQLIYAAFTLVPRNNSQSRFIDISKSEAYIFFDYYL